MKSLKIIYTSYDEAVYKELKKYAIDNGLLMSDEFRRGEKGRSNQMIYVDGCFYFGAGFVPSKFVCFAKSYDIFIDKIK